MKALGLHCPGTVNFNTKVKSYKEIKFTLWGYDNLLKSYDETKKKFVMDYLGANPLANIYTDEMFVETPGSKPHVYISAIICGYSNYALAIHTSDTRDLEIANITLDCAISNVGVDALKDPILQTDHAMIYFSKEFGKHCKEIGFKQSMGWVGTSTDNRPIEVFWKELRLRYLWKLPYAERTIEKLDVACQEWMYNHNNRETKNLGWRTPSQVLVSKWEHFSWVVVTNKLNKKTFTSIKWDNYINR